MNTLSLSFEGHQFRFVGTKDKPEWVATDVVEILYPDADPRNYSNYLSKVPDEWKGHKQIMTPGGMQTVTTLFEPGIYYLIARSNSPIAIPFQKWLYEEVLPSIRKHGCYPPPATPFVDEAFAFTLEMLKLAGVTEGLRASFALTQKAKLDPQNALVYEQAKKLLSTQMVVTEMPVSPTELGKAMASKLNLSYTPSAQKINYVVTL